MEPQICAPTPQSHNVECMNNLETGPESWPPDLHIHTKKTNLPSKIGELGVDNRRPLELIG